MRILIYEFVTGGGWYQVAPNEPPSGSLLAEGSAMLEAALRDFAQLPGVELHVLRDRRLEPLPQDNVEVHLIDSAAGEVTALESVAGVADHVLLIAPELDGHLLTRSRLVEKLGTLLFSPSSEFVEVAGDKWRTYQALSNAGVPTPRSCLVKREQPVLPDWRAIVAKRHDGCGSQGVHLVRPPSQVIDWDAIGQDLALVQEYCSGQAASVAMLCGPSGIYPLPGCTQRLRDNSFDYLGGECPLPEPLHHRAQALSRRVIEAMPAARGFVGVDLVLGDAADGSQDYVIEINPRLTTSYVGLRTLSETNLALAMLDVVQGREPQLAWKPGRVSWSTDGVVSYRET